MAFIRNTLFISGLALMLSSSTDAHITLSPKYAEPNQNLTTAFHVPHGCNGSSTVAITVAVPQDITVLTPRQVNNWTLTTDYTDSSNTTINTISWSGGYLKSTDALDFPIVLTVPNAGLSSKPNVTYYFPVLQNCEVGSTNWDITNGSSVGEPAPQLVVVKNATQAAIDALTINTGHNSTASESSSAHTNAANGLYAGLLPIAAIVALAISI